jgi:hypothetical protein
VKGEFLSVGKRGEFFFFEEKRGEFFVFLVRNLENKIAFWKIICHFQGVLAGQKWLWYGTGTCLFVVYGFFVCSDSAMGHCFNSPIDIDFVYISDLALNNMDSLDITLAVTSVATQRDAAVLAWDGIKAATSAGVSCVYDVLAVENKVQPRSALALLQEVESDFFTQATCTVKDTNVYKIDLEGQTDSIVEQHSKYYGPESEYYVPLFFSGMLRMLLKRNKKAKPTAFFTQFTRMQRLISSEHFKQFLLSYSELYESWLFESGELPPGIFHIPKGNTFVSLMRTTDSETSTSSNNAQSKRKASAALTRKKQSDSKKRICLSAGESQSLSKTSVGVLSPSDQQRRRIAADMQSSRHTPNNTKKLKKKSIADIIELGGGFFESKEDLPEKTEKGPFWKYQTLIHTLLPGAVLSQKSTVIWCPCSKLFYDQSQRPHKTFSSFQNHVDKFHQTESDSTQQSLVAAFQKYKARPSGGHNDPIPVIDDNNNNDHNAEQNQGSEEDDHAMDDADAPADGAGGSDSDDHAMDNADAPADGAGGSDNDADGSEDNADVNESSAQASHQRPPATREEVVHNINMGLQLVRSGTS